MRRLLSTHAAVASILALGLLAAPPVAAQSWPTKPVRFIVPFPPGGSVDPLARMVGVKLGESLGQQFVVENKPGAAGSIGAADVRKTLTEQLGMDLIVSSPQAQQKWLTDEMQRWGKVVRDNNIKPD